MLAFLFIGVIKVMLAINTKIANLNGGTSIIIKMVNPKINSLNTKK
jgi:hypothetical protein